MIVDKAPANFIFLWDVAGGDIDWRRVERKSLAVMVHSPICEI